MNWPAPVADDSGFLAPGLATAFGLDHMLDKTVDGTGSITKRFFQCVGSGARQRRQVKRSTGTRHLEFKRPLDGLAGRFSGAVEFGERCHQLIPDRLGQFGHLAGAVGDDGVQCGHDRLGICGVAL